MIKERIFKPLPRRFHVVFWTGYFTWIMAVNTYKFGWWHIFIVLAVTPLMLGISYVNRAWLRRILFRRFAPLRLTIVLGYFLLTAVAVFLVLYKFPTELSRRVLRNPRMFKAIDFVIDVFTFYITFALKGILILATEIFYNLSTGIFRHLGWIRYQSQESIKAQLFRNWAVHFMGNLTQSFIHLAKKNPAILTRMDLFFALEVYAMRKLNFEKNSLGKLDDELFYLQQLLQLYRQQQIKLQLEIQDRSKTIIPLVLLSICKNMVKHGDFSDYSFESMIYVFSDTEKVSISCRNKVSARSGWIFEAGGTGLEQMTKLLHLQYGEAFSLIKKVDDGIFYLNLEIKT
ncbi:hypothetical protein AAW12_19050 [Sphingobacterium sp. Ag1]|uniref:hypothetical protein n=1 Tax=Sphingobacterium sp. Ag1 TaxID=1643451 RepID=UPI0006276386|nr:hypothetical protein [Sphingobacterium sp. Ag1]KKO89700.1 hypothetical protein AAW12_19050 [Sphingobacterium sp. Ag1]